LWFRWQIMEVRRRHKYQQSIHLERYRKQS
jgi:hypothetical protein